jgi:exosome complex RNA-binding protein Rrp4
MRKLEDNEAMLFIPQSLVSMVIGTKGRTINSIKRDVGCEIFVN